MLELIGRCITCGVEVICENGFFNGVHEDGKLFCHACANKIDEA